MTSVVDPDPGSGPFLTLDPGSRMDKRSRSGSGMINNLKKIYLNSLMRIRIRDPEIFLTLFPGSGMEKIRIRHPG
jgi:hypothetical protein